MTQAVPITVIRPLTADGSAEPRSVHAVDRRLPHELNKDGRGDPFELSTCTREIYGDR